MNSLTSKTVLLTFSAGVFGKDRRISSKAIAQETNAEESAIKSSKERVSSAALKSASSVVAKMGRNIRLLSLPSPINRDGLYLIPIGLVDMILHDLEEGEVEFNAEVDAFCASYEQQVADAPMRLGSLFNAADYPAAVNVRGEFHWDFNIATIETPHTLEGVSDEAMAQCRAKAEAAWKDASEKVEALLAQQMKDLLSHAVGRMGTKGGKPKRLHESAFGNIDNFLATFAPRNVQDNEELATISAQLQELTKGIDVKALRDNETLRQSMRAEFKKVEAKLDTFIEDQPRRAFDFD